MRSVSRRTILTAAGVAAVAAALPAPQIAFASGARSAAAAGGEETLLANIIASLAGTEETNSAAAVQGKLSAMYDAAKKNLAALVPEPTTELFSGLPLGTDDKNLTSSFQKLFQIAVATAMPVGSSTIPTDLSGDAETQKRVIDALTWLYDNHFGDQASGYYGNWYNWEIGIPIHAGRTLALLHTELAASAPELAATYVQAMDLYLRNGKNGDVDLDSRFHTGANLADITTNRIVQGAVLADSDRVSKAISDQLTVYTTIDPYNLQHGVTDGFYPDGSFLQHSSVPYTGSYGIGLLSRVTATIAMLNGTSFATEPSLATRINGWLANSFSPVIAEGWMMEMIKGRSVSRTTTGYSNSTNVVESIVALSAYSTAETTTDLTAYVTYLHRLPEMKISPDAFSDPANVVRYAETVADSTIVPKDLVPAAATFAYNAMDRHVHRRPAFTFALARSSERVSKYEYMSGENLMPWFQGDGAHYLYLPGDDQRLAYGVDYFTVVEPHRLAGVTAPVEDRMTIPELYGQPFYDNPDAGFTSSSVKQNTYVYFPLGTNRFSGGASLGAYAVSGMEQSDDAAYAAKQAGELPDDFVVYANSRSKKSWFMFDDEVVVVASGITDEHGRATITTVDSRIADASDEVALSGETRDGGDVTGPGRAAALAWLRYANTTRGNAIGYIFFDDQEIDVRLDDVQRSRRIIRSSNPNTLVTKKVFDISVTREADAEATALTYAIIPGADTESLQAYGGSSSAPEIVASSTDVHAVRHAELGLFALNAFTEKMHSVGKLRVDGAASVIVQNADRGRTHIAVSDPTFAREKVSVTVNGHRAILDESHPDVTAVSVPGGTRLDFATHNAYGKTIVVTVRGHGIV